MIEAAEQDILLFSRGILDDKDAVLEFLKARQGEQGSSFLYETIEYVRHNKLDVYARDPEKLSTLFEVMSSASYQLHEQVQEARALLDSKHESPIRLHPDEQQMYDELDRLHQINERLGAYENLYHNQ